MSTLASVRGVRLSPQKGRLVADAIRGLPVEKALDALRFQTNKGSGIVKNLLESAIANAEHNDGVDIDDLFVEKIFVERGTKLKRFAACAKGRGVRIEKPTCHIFISVATKETKG